MLRSFGLITLLVFVYNSTSFAGVFSPRIQRENEADAWSLATLAPHTAWEKANDADLAKGLIDLLAQRVVVTSFSPREGAEKIVAWAKVNDPMKLWHAYGYADRAAIADAFAALWSQAGRGQTRIVELSESPCVLVEMETNGRWGVVDPASRTVFAGENRELMTWEDILATPAIWEKLSVTALPHADLAAKRESWMKSALTRRPASGSSSHTASFSLRRGERFTRFATPQGERWQMTDAELKEKFRVAFWNEAPRGPKQASEGPAAYAHGRFDYEPALNDDGADVRDGADVLRNIQFTADGLTLAKDGEGSAIFRVASPFPIVGLVGKIESAADDKEASVVEIDAKGATLSYSKDYGATWLGLDLKQSPAMLDLTQQVAGEYSYQLRIELKGKSGDAILKRLKITTWVQCSPLSFPALTTGENTFRIATGDSLGRPTRAMVLNASTADENGFLRPVIHPPKDYRPGDAKERVIGPFTMRIAGPAGSSIAWLQLGGRFATKADNLQPEAVTWGVATGSPQNFQPITFGRLAQEMDTVYVPQEPVPAVFCRVEGRPALNQLRVTAHCLDLDRDAASPWQITHRWTVNNEPRTHTVEVRDQKAYTVSVSEAPAADQAVEFVVPGSRAPQ